MTPEDPTISGTLSPLRSVLFVCTANICRSPMAEATLRALLAKRGITGAKIQIESAGTHDYHAGKPPFDAAVEALRTRGYGIGVRSARRVGASDFDRFDHILAMDRANLTHLLSICPTRYKHKLELLLEYGDANHGRDIPDPFGGSSAEYQRSLDLIEEGCRGLVAVLSRAA